MESINVLVTAIGGPTALGILKCLKEFDCIRLIGIDSQRYTAGNMFCDAVYCITRISNTEDYKKEIIEILGREKIDIVFPTLQDEITLYQEFRNKIPAIVALPTSDKFEALIDKEKLYEYLGNNGMNKYIPKYYVFQNNSELKQLMNECFVGEQYVCVKRVKGHGGLGVVLLTNRKNYLQALREGRSKVWNVDDYYEIYSTDRRLVMEYLDGPEYSVDALIYNREVVAIVSRKRNRVSNGIVIDGTVEFNQEVITAATQIAKIIVNNGFINLQFINYNKGYKLTDVNARFCGSQVMSFGAGVNFPYLFIQYNLLKEYVAVSPKWNTRMVRYWESCFFDV